MPQQAWNERGSHPRSQVKRTSGRWFAGGVQTMRPDFAMRQTRSRRTEMRNHLVYVELNQKVGTHR